MAQQFQLNENQQLAVEAESHILCCACPGSGKTRVLVLKAVRILRRNPRAKILLATFSSEAAREMRERIHEMLPSVSDSQIMTGTFHSFGLQQLKSIGAHKRVLSAVEVRHLAARSAEEGGMTVEASVAEEWITLCRIDPALAQEYPDWAAAAERYKAHVAEQGACDFTDMLINAVALMKEGKLPPIKADWFLCDEWQDADRLQFEWLMLHLAQGALSCVVGDDDQSVYAFRRALGYQGMMDYVAMTNAKIITLDINYRSTEGILQSASRLIANNVDRIPKVPKAHRGYGPLPTVIFFDKSEEQIDKLIARLDEICTDPAPPPLEPGGRVYRFGVRPKQVAVLARTNDHLRAVEQAFIGCRIPYVRTGRSIWKNRSVQTYLSLLNSLWAGDSVGLDVALHWAKVPADICHKLAAIGNGSVRGVLKGDHPVKTLPGGPVVHDFVAKGRGWLRKLAEQSPDGAIYGASGWMSAVLTHTCGHDEDFDEEAPVGKRPIDVDYIELARDILARMKGPLVQRIRTAQQDNRRDDMPRIVLTTFHSSKGLEFDHVFLVDVVDGVVPSSASICEDALAEERRIFYVAMTRAADHLYIFTKRKDKTSEFLIEAGLYDGKPVNKEALAA